MSICPGFTTANGKVLTQSPRRSGKGKAAWRYAQVVNPPKNEISMYYYSAYYARILKDTNFLSFSPFLQSTTI